MGILDYLGFNKPDEKRALSNFGSITTAAQLAEALELNSSDIDTADYKKNLEQGYIVNSYVAACINKKTTAAKEPVWELWVKDRHITKKPPVTSPYHSLWNILFEKHFYTGCYWDDIVEQSIIYNDLAGEYFLYCPDAAAAKRGNGYLTYLEPNEVEIKPSLYEIKKPNKPVKTISKEIKVGEITFEPVLHKFNWAAGSNRGISRLSSAWASVKITNSGSKWNYNLLKNGARPSFLMMFDGTGLDMTAEKYAKIKNSVGTFSGSDNTGKALVMQAGPNTNVVELGLNSKDMDFSMLEEISAKRIALALGVPPVLLGFKGDSTYSNIDTAYETLYTQTVMPELEAFRTQVEGWFRTLWPDISLKINYDNVMALNAVRNKELDYKLKMANFLTRNEMRELLGYEPEEDNINNTNNETTNETTSEDSGDIMEDNGNENDPSTTGTEND